MTAKAGTRISGVVLLAVGGIGFLTVADDLRHVGELIGVGSILLAGLLLLAVSFVIGRRNQPR